MNTTHTPITAPQKPQAGHNKRRIFIIDDDVSLTLAMKINLEATNNFIVGICNESDHAIENAEIFHPDIILLDLVMPGLDGGDLSAMFKQNPYLWDIPVIMVTALVSNNEVGVYDGVHSGHHLIIAKPVQFAKLLHAIDTALLSHAHH